MKTAIISISVVAGLLGLFGAFQLGKDFERRATVGTSMDMLNQLQSGPKETKVSPAGYLLDSKVIQGNYGNTLEATLVNASGKNLEAATLTWVCFDSQNNQLGIHASYAAYWKPGATYRIRDSINPNVSRVELQTVAYYEQPSP